MGTRAISARKAFATLAVAATGIGCVAALAASPAQAAKPVKPSPTPTSTAPTYPATVVGTSPQAAAQPTARGKAIHDLFLDGGRFYLGYGDYDANTGPTDVTTFDPATGTMSASLVTVPTEEINVYRKVNGAVYAPMIDPRGAWTANQGYATNSTGAWTNQFKAPFVHVYDVATRDGADLWAVGSSVYEPSTTSGGAAAYRSTDGGTTWSRVATDTSTPEGGYERYYWAAALNGKMYLQAEGVTGGAPLRVFDGTAWSTLPGKPCYTVDARQVEVFKGKIVCTNYSTNAINTFDGSTITDSQAQSTGTAQDFAVPGDGYIYALAGAKVYRSADALTWTALAAAPAGATSIGVYNNAVYLGMGDSTIVRLDGLTAAPVATPTASPTPTTTAAPCKTNGKKAC